MQGMHAEPTVILEVDRRLAQFIQSARPTQPDQATPIEQGRWLAALEVRKILQAACPYDRAVDAACHAAWFAEKYGEDAAVVADDR